MNIFQSISKYFSDRKTKRLLDKIEQEKRDVEQEKRDAELQKEQDDIRTAELIAEYKYKEKHGLLYSQRTQTSRSTLSHRDIYEDDEDCKRDSGSGDFLISAGIAAVTGSALLGGIIGGDMTGGIVGDLLDGDLFD